MVVDKRVSILFIVFGVVVVLVNTLIPIAVQNQRLIDTFTQMYFYVPVICVIILGFSLLLNPIVSKILHLVILLTICVIGILDQYDSFYGIGFAIISFVLAYKYGFIQRGIRWKIALMTIALVILIEYSSIRNSTGLTGIALDSVAFISFFIAFLYIMYQEEINRLISTNASLKKSMVELQLEKKSLEDQMSEIQKKMDENAEAIEERARIGTKSHDDVEREVLDFLKHRFHLTKTEILVAREIVQGGLSNRAIGEKLKKKETTIKFHSHNLLQKLELSSRSEFQAYVNRLKSEYEPRES